MFLNVNSIPYPHSLYIVEHRSGGSSELVDLDRVVGHVGQRQRLVPLRAAVVVVALNGGRALLEADVVEAGEAGAVDVLNSVVGHQKVFLPAHEHEIRLTHCLVVERVRVERFGVLVERHELALRSPHQIKTLVIPWFRRWREKNRTISIFPRKRDTISLPDKVFNILEKENVLKGEHTQKGCTTWKTQ